MIYYQVERKYKKGITRVEVEKSHRGLIDGIEFPCGKKFSVIEEIPLPSEFDLYVLGDEI